LDACFVVTDSAEQKLAYVYFRGGARPSVGSQAARARHAARIDRLFSAALIAPGSA